MMIEGLNERFAIVRQEHGLNAKKFAESLGIDPTIISAIETGKREPSKEVLLKLATAYNMNIHWLLTGEGEIFLNKKVEPGVSKVYTSSEKGVEKTDPLRSVEEKHHLMANPGALIDQRLEKIEVEIANLKKVEAEIAEIKSSLNKPSINTPDFGTFTSEPEPEYGEDYENIAYVDNIAAGRPIYASEGQATIPVPKRFIKTRPEDYYTGRIKGTSMIDAGIPNGALVLIFKSDIPRHNVIQVVERRGEVTLKRVWEIPGKGWKLYFEDGTGDDIEVGPDDEFHVQGDFVAVLPEN